MSVDSRDGWPVTTPVDWEDGRAREEIQDRAFRPKRMGHNYRCCVIDGFRSCPSCLDLVCPGPAGQQDEVLVEFEPDVVIRVEQR